MMAAAIALLQVQPRFERIGPLPTLPPVWIDAQQYGIGVAQTTARSKNLQARILWIDGTANLDKLSNDADIAALVAQIKDAGFNTVIMDVKPIVGHTLYPSAIAPKLTGWRDQTIPADYDPLAAMVRETKSVGLPLFVCLNAFSEGHSMFKIGPGYAKPEWQSVLYEINSYVRLGTARIPLTSTKNKVGEGAAIVDDLTKVKDADFAVTLDKQHRVVDGFERPGSLKGTPTVPKGGLILAAKGSVAEALRNAATPGEVLTIETEPVFVKTSERPEQQYPLMMNPHHPDLIKYELSILREVATKYDIAGVCYDDRLRYAGINADFSAEARAQFEQMIGRKITRWPEEVFEFTMNWDLSRGMRPGPLYDAWMAFRARTSQAWVRNVRKTLNAVRPGLKVGVYSGSWYGDYPAYGQNFGAPTLGAGFWFLTPSYREAGLAPDLDFLMTGCYYPTPTIYEAMERAKGTGGTIEAAGHLTNRVVRDQCWAYAGIALEQFKNDPDGLGRALQAACASTQGVMVFDLSHDIGPMWKVFKGAFAQPATAPHQTNVLADVRRRRTALDKAGHKDPPIVISAGSTGVGF